MIKILHDIWPFVEKTLLPIFAIIGGLIVFSINYYWRTCRELRKLEKHLKANNTEATIADNSLYLINLFDIFYGFRSTSKFDQELLRFDSYSVLYKRFIAFRKFYRIAFPVLIALTIIGISINELIIDK